jgi:hypothetical protein
MEETTIREPERIRQDSARKLLRVIRGPKLRTVLGYFLGEVFAIPSVVDLRLTADGRIVALIEGKPDFRADLSNRSKLIRWVHSIARTAGLDGDELGYFLAQVAKIKREE